MKVFKIEIENYRLLKCFSMYLENELSLVIGKNNTGKTSILLVLDKFLCQSDKDKFLFDDLNIEFKKELKTLIENADETPEENFKQLGIKLRLFIEYHATDNLSNVSRVMMDLDPDINVVVLGFEYTLDFNGYSRIRKEYRDFEAKENNKKQIKADYKIRNVYEFLRQRHADYFKINKRSFAYNPITKLANEENYIDLVKEEISTKEIINFKFISAKRDVANKEVDKTLSGQISRIYKRTEASDE